MGTAQITLRLDWDLGVSKGSLPHNFAEALPVALAGTRLVHNVQEVGLGKEPLFLGDVGPGGLLVARNNDDTNYVTIAPGIDPAAIPLARLLPGDICLLRVDNGSLPYVAAAVAPCELEYWLFEP
jgi:hypothetical protein